VNGSKPFGSRYEPETLSVLYSAFDAAWTDLQAALETPLSPVAQAKAKMFIAKNLLAAADAGERDPDRLKARALQGVIGV
jgi:hypothetical protein